MCNLQEHLNILNHQVREWRNATRASSSSSLQQNIIGECFFFCIRNISKTKLTLSKRIQDSISTKFTQKYLTLFSPSQSIIIRQCPINPQIMVWMNFCYLNVTASLRHIFKALGKFRNLVAANLKSFVYI